MFGSMLLDSTATIGGQMPLMAKSSSPTRSTAPTLVTTSRT